MIRTLTVGEKSISYELIRKKVKNINLRIYPDGKIKVSANAKVSVETVESFILSRSAFILSALDRFEARKSAAPEEKQYDNNDSVRIFDEILTLKVFREQRNCVHRSDGELWLYVKDEKDRELKERTLDAYLKALLLEKAAELLPEVYARLSDHNIDMPEIKARRMKTRWGSCHTAKKTVTLSITLAEHPAECLKFVLSHELCHLVHPNHSKEFYALLSSIMPEWKRCKDMLNNK